MKKFNLILWIVSLVVLSNVAKADYVNGHYRSDGTYVNGYYRTSPDSSRYNNYSSQGNYNPYTGEKGTVNPNKY